VLEISYRIWAHHDLIAIIRTGAQIGALQQFTNDKRLLNSAVEQLRWNFCNRVGLHVFPTFNPQFPQFGSNACGFSTYYQKIRALRFILDAMGQLPGRKSLILMSDSLPREDQEIKDAEEGYYLQVMVTDKLIDKNKQPPAVQWVDFEIVK
jgi:hypothetical protein